MIVLLKMTLNKDYKGNNGFISVYIWEQVWEHILCGKLIGIYRISMNIFGHFLQPYYACFNHMTFMSEIFTPDSFWIYNISAGCDSSQAQRLTWKLEIEQSPDWDETLSHKMLACVLEICTSRLCPLIRASCQFLLFMWRSHRVLVRVKKVNSTDCSSMLEVLRVDGAGSIKSLWSSVSEWIPAYLISLSDRTPLSHTRFFLYIFFYLLYILLYLFSLDIFTSQAAGCKWCQAWCRFHTAQFH